MLFGLSDTWTSYCSSFCGVCYGFVGWDIWYTSIHKLRKTMAQGFGSYTQKVLWIPTILRAFGALLCILRKAAARGAETTWD